MTLEDQHPLEPPCSQAQEVSQADFGDCHTPLEPKRSVELTLEAQHTITEPISFNDVHETTGLHRSC